MAITEFPIATTPLATSAALLDPLRHAVEAASGGSNTIIYDDNGNANYVRIMPRTTYGSLGSIYVTGMNASATDTLEAFKVDGDVKEWIGIGIYPGAYVGGNLVSQPGLDPANTIDWDDAVAACAAMGAGWRMMSVWDWALVTHQCMARGSQPTGNTGYGRGHSTTHRVGRRVDGDYPGLTTGTPRTLTGSGPNEWNHNSAPDGIADLVGNVWEWQSGFKIVSNAAWLAPDNTDPTNEAVFVDQSYSMPAAGTWSGLSNAGATDLIKRALIVPATGVTSPNGALIINATGEKLPMHGGAWSNTGSCGLAAFNLNFGRGDNGGFIGVRPMYVPA